MKTLTKTISSWTNMFDHCELSLGSSLTKCTLWGEVNLCFCVEPSPPKTVHNPSALTPSRSAQVVAVVSEAMPKKLNRAAFKRHHQLLVCWCNCRVTPTQKYKYTRGRRLRRWPLDNYFHSK